MENTTMAIRKLILSILTVLLLILSLTTSTFAWFQINSIGTVSGFNFTTVTGLGFKVSIDDKVYSNDLSNDQMLMAMLEAYDQSQYKIITSQSSDGKKVTQHIEYYYDELVNGKLEKTSKALTSQELQQHVSENISLLPCTSNNGIDMYTYYGDKYMPNTGRFLEFSVYFKTESDNLSDGYNINIYLSGNERKEINGRVVDSTAIKSDSLAVKLLAGLTTSTNTYSKGDEITVSSVNALRYSSEDASYNDNVRKTNQSLKEEYEAKLEAGENPLLPEYLELKNATIYEPTDSYDLGSYSTDYDGEDAVLKRLYSSSVSAGFTYYNNLVSYDNRIKPMEYDTKPTTIRSLVDEDGNDRKDLPIITNVKSGEGSKKVTFRFWLEGFDADCFDGLANSINVKLSFRSEYLK